MDEQLKILKRTRVLNSLNNFSWDASWQAESATAHLSYRLSSSLEYQYGCLWHHEMKLDPGITWRVCEMAYLMYSKLENTILYMYILKYCFLALHEIRRHSSRVFFCLKPF